ncbi:MAG TPA: sigma-70 family RNA polymerase sigma factor [Candidatus Cybelea sp.]|jgi:RNA polymerase sigma-70 factor (ECF subfamily)|nr:sigma-70 family RNA polymerase sigma factor [Candidatus Cybelea sp.]
MNGVASHDAFVELVNGHRGILFRIARAYCRNEDDREDLIAETIAQLWSAFARFDGRSSFPTWMYRVAVNVAIAFVRKDVRKRRYVAPGGEGVLERIAASEERAEDERLDLLYELIDDLAPLDRALMLLYLDEYPHVEIAAILGITETNVATKIGRIKERFRRSVAAGGAL